MTADAAIDRAAASDFSTAGFSAAQLEESLAAADKQAAWLAWVASTTGETRGFARRQLVVVQAAYMVAVAAIAAAELAQPKLPAWLLTAWLVESIANLALRLALFSRMFILKGPADLARSPALRSIPLVCNLIVGCHWIWTSTLFIGTELDATTVAVIVAYLLMSVAAISISPASPITAVIYPAFLWVPFTLCSATSGWAPPALLVVLMVVVALTLAMTYVAVTTHTRWPPCAPGSACRPAASAGHRGSGDVPPRHPRIRQVRAHGAGADAGPDPFAGRVPGLEPAVRRRRRVWRR